MKVFIFGAGASHGSLDIGNVHLISPLVDDLFSDDYFAYADKYKITKNELEDLRSGQNKFESLEKYLTDKWEQVTKKQSPKARQNGYNFFSKLTFYIWWLFQNVSVEYNNNVNSYYQLIAKLIERDYNFGLVNFNYDTILDKAYQDNCWPLSSLDDYIKYDYIKPHGSVNWFLTKRGNDPTVKVMHETITDINMRQEMAIKSMYKDEPIPWDITVIDPKHESLKNSEYFFGGVSNHQYCYPLVIMPLTIKLFDHFSGFYDKVITSGIKLLSKASEIFIIGYGANDEIVKDLFSQVKENTPLHVIGRSNPEAIFERIKKWKPDIKKGKMESGGFTHFINNLDAFL